MPIDDLGCIVTAWELNIFLFKNQKDADLYI